MLRWILGFAARGAFAALLALAATSVLQVESESNLLLAVFALLYPGFLPIAMWYPVDRWVENELLVRTLGFISNGLFFGLLGAWLYRARSAHPSIRIPTPVAVWAFFVWFCLVGSLNLKMAFS